ncbi:anoctamin-7-like isoform X2 [Halichondria panicea]|uniref:anoctamin-7-like isoform X2 n=1 Tax=Halichondria panicea TaxID=6063 RepID=UPI00312B9ACF
MAQSGEVAIGFEGLDAAGETPDQSSYTVKFSASTPEPDVNEKSEEIVLLEKKGDSSKAEEDQNGNEKDQTVFFEDGVRRIDFVLVYQLQVEKKGGFCKKDTEDTEEQQDKRGTKRDRFIESCKEMGLEFELQDCAESPDRKSFYYKVHATHIALLKGAEELFLRMPISENNLKVSSWRQRFFDYIKVRDPMDPNIPSHLVRDVYFTAPFKLERKESFLNWDDEEKFFTNAQRSTIVWHMLQNARYGEDSDQIGILRLTQNKTISTAYPLHESSYKFKKDDDPATMTDRQFLKSQWSSGWAWYKKQPLDQIRRYFGEKIGIYFAWLGFYTMWLLPASLVGLIVFIYGLSTINTIDFRNAIANATCDNNNRYDLYMCPRCDRRCAFWFLTESCLFNYASQLFDNGATVFFAIFMSFWAVLFLEFWKRKQFYLQFDWDVLGYEETAERARPEFEQRIKRHIRSCKTEKAKEKFYIWNPVLETKEYIQPQSWLVPKLLTTFSVLGFMAGIVIAVTVAVLVYRLVVAAAIYAVVANISGGPTVGDIVVSVSGAVIQLVTIIIMNRIYEWLAYKLTTWELQRTQTEFEDSFIVKMYIFQFLNFYTSLFYIAFFKGNISGYPGNYNRLGGTRLDECATYGCLLELTIQLAIIFLGKQILNNVVEIGVPYLKRFINWLKHKEETDEDVYARWEKDYDLIELSNHGLFFEYLELVVQYGFATLFVAAFPLAPLFALLNNYFEIRIDAHKFVVVLRRPVAERAQDIGAWFGILTIVSQMSVITNAFIIVITSQFIPQAVFQYTTPEPVRLSEYVEWSLSEFPITQLVDGDAFPSYNALNIDLADHNGDDIESNDAEPLKFKYLPFVDQDCVRMINSSVRIANTTVRPGSNTTAYGFLKEDPIFREIYMTSVFNYTGQCADAESCNTISPRSDSQGECYRNQTCKFRGFANAAGQDDAQSLKYWQLQTARLAFVIVFEHMIFVIAGILAFLVPDVPQSVKNEIQREKLLAAEALNEAQEKSGIVNKTAAELDERNDSDDDNL